MNTPKETNTQQKAVASDDLLSLGERRRLLVLGKKLEELKTKQNVLLTKARAIIGFETAESLYGIEEELRDAWQECEEAEMIFVEYANATRKRWKLEEAVEHMKALMDELKVSPEDISW